MAYTKNASSTVKAVKGNEVIYLSQADEARGLDAKLDMQGYEIIAL